jgi:cobalt/nickel transport system permease protein
MKKKKILLTVGVLSFLMLCGVPAQAMHISEGILPVKWAGLWFILSAPFLFMGLREIKKRSAETPHYKALAGLVGAAVFIISCMPIPVPIAGSCSHPCGTGIAAIIIGPWVTVVVTSVALLLQALFLAHGGLSTFGADVFSMGVAGAFVGYGIFKLGTRLGLPVILAAFMAGVTSDWATYTVTSFELSTALGTPESWLNMFTAILIAFMPTQIPLGVFEGFLAGGAYRFIAARRPELLKPLNGNVFAGGVK